MDNHKPGDIDPVVQRIAERTRRDRYHDSLCDPGTGLIGDPVLSANGQLLAGAFFVWIISALIISANTLINTAWQCVWGVPQSGKPSSANAKAWPIELRVLWILALAAFSAYMIVLLDKWGS